MSRVVFVSGHLDLTEAEFLTNYTYRLFEAHQAGAKFIVGDARGCDTMAQIYLDGLGADVTVYHMFTAPRNNVGNRPTVGGFEADLARDEAMTAASTEDLAWVRPGREKSGTAKNLARRSSSCRPG